MKLSTLAGAVVVAVLVAAAGYWATRTQSPSPDATGTRAVPPERAIPNADRELPLPSAARPAASDLASAEPGGERAPSSVHPPVQGAAVVSTASATTSTEVTEADAPKTVAEIYASVSELLTMALTQTDAFEAKAADWSQDELRAHVESLQAILPALQAGEAFEGAPELKPAQLALLEYEVGRLARRIER